MKSPDVTDVCWSLTRCPALCPTFAAPGAKQVKRVCVPLPHPCSRAAVPADYGGSPVGECECDTERAI